MSTQNNWNNNISTGSAITLNSGTNTINISSDASATTVNLATGNAAKVVTLGSTSGASSLALKTGTSDFSLASATGTIISAQDTGEITYPLQTAFMAYLGSDDNNVTGNSTYWTFGSSTALTEVFDQNGDFNTNGTLTAPVTGRYTLSRNLIYNCDATSGGIQYFSYIQTSNRDIINVLLPTRKRVTGYYGTSGYLSSCGTITTDMDAGDTAIVKFVSDNGSKVDDVIAGSFFSGFLTV